MTRADGVLPRGVWRDRQTTTAPAGALCIRGGDTDWSRSFGGPPCERPQEDDGDTTSPLVRQDPGTRSPIQPFPPALVEVSGGGQEWTSLRGQEHREEELTRRRLRWGRSQQAPD